jgi:hypothetical protein
MKNPHSELVNKILLEIGATEYCRVWKNHTGLATPIGRSQPMHFGLPGSADIIGILKNGKFLAIECKTGAAKQSKKQIKFEKMIRTFCGVYLLVRESDSVLPLIQEEAEK